MSPITKVGHLKTQIFIFIAQYQTMKSHLVLKGWVVNVDSVDGTLSLRDDGAVVFAREFVTGADLLATIVAPVKSVLKDGNGIGVADGQLQDVL